jgi:hypothetical protein
MPARDSVRRWLPEKRKVTGSTPVPTTSDGQAERLVIGRFLIPQAAAGHAREIPGAAVVTVVRARWSPGLTL